MSIPESPNKTPFLLACLQALNRTLPNCEVALDLTQKGIERDLNGVEKVLLKYHSPLCPFCACSKNQFDIMTARRIKAESARKNALKKV